MKFIVTRDYEELSQVMAQLMLKHMHTEKERTNIAITTGSTCIQGYRLLAKQVHGRPWFDPVHYYIFDEFWIQDERHEKYPFVKSVWMKNISTPQRLRRIIFTI